MRHPEKIREGQGRRYWKNRDKIREKYRPYKRDYVRRIRIEVLSQYSGGPPRCLCCGEDRIDFLSLDHVNGLNREKGERQHSYGRGGFHLYMKLKKAGFPDGFQVLCFNCNCARGFFGECPHQREATSERDTEHREEDD